MLECCNREKHDWETREDVNTMVRYQQLKNDPERFNRAKECLSESLKMQVKALSDSPAPSVPGRRNPATIMKL